jgi:hypothetical protein
MKTAHRKMAETTIPVPHVTLPPLPAFDDVLGSEGPPPLPPIFDGSEWGGGEDPPPAVVIDTRYSDLRKCSRSIRLIGRVIFGFLIFVAVCFIASAAVWTVGVSAHVERPEATGQRAIAREMSTTTGATVIFCFGSATAWVLGGYVANLLCRTLSHVLYVLMDNEENTRRTSLMIDQPMQMPLLSIE